MSCKFLPLSSNHCLIFRNDHQPIATKSPGENPMGFFVDESMPMSQKTWWGLSFSFLVMFTNRGLPNHQQQLWRDDRGWLLRHEWLPLIGPWFLIFQTFHEPILNRSPGTNLKGFWRMLERGITYQRSSVATVSCWVIGSNRYLANDHGDVLLNGFVRGHLEKFLRRRHYFLIF